MSKNKEKLNKGKIKLVSFISFFMGFLQSLFVYIMSIYFKEASGTENVSLFYIFSYSVVLVLLLNLHKIIRILGKANVFFFALLSKIIAIFFLLYFPPSFSSIAVLMFYIIFGTIQWVSLDTILESFSTDSMSGRIRGRQISIISLGYILAPILSTNLLNNFGYQSIFFILLFCNSIILVISLLGFRRINEKFQEDLSIKNFFKKLKGRKNVQRIYIISFVLDFFYAMAIIYVPLYLISIGISLSAMGIIFSCMLIPFIIFPYPLGILADRRMGEKEMLGISVVILGISMLLMYFTNSKDIWVWGAILLVSRVGASILESMRDSYFYKRISSTNMDIIDFFRTSRPMAYIISSGMAFLIFAFYPQNAIKVIFLMVALVSFLAIFPICKLIDNKGELER